MPKKPSEADEAKAAHTKTVDAISAMRVKVNATHKEMLQLKTENRLLRRHQAEVRDWLADAIQQWVDAKDTADEPRVKHEIHQHAEKLLEEAQRYAQ